MKAPKSLFDRPGRATAVVGAVVAVSATAVVALVSGTAAATPDAAEPGRCTKNVNVRAQPDVTSQIVALCEQGTKVKVGEQRAGFLQLTNLGGWAAQEYISVNGSAPAPSQRATGPEDDDEDDSASDGTRADRADDDASSSGGRTRGSDGTDGEDDGDEYDGDADEEERTEPATGQRSGGLGGLLG